MRGEPMSQQHALYFQGLSDDKLLSAFVAAAHVYFSSRGERDSHRDYGVLMAALDVARQRGIDQACLGEWDKIVGAQWTKRVNDQQGYTAKGQPNAGVGTSGD